MDAQLEPFTEQEPFLRDDKRYFGYISGVGAGKTAVGVIRDALNMELWNPGHMGAIVAPTTQMIKNAILPLMREFGLMERWEYKGPQAEQPGLHSPNGSRAVILSADNTRQIERLASLNLAWWHLDENKDIDPRARQILIQRLRKGDYTNGYVTTTPKGKNHDYDFFVGEHTDKIACPECGNHVTPDGQRVTCGACDTMFPTDDGTPVLREWDHGGAHIYETDDRLAITGVPTDANPHLDRSDVQAIRDAHPSGLLAQEVEGEFIEVGSGLLTEEMLSATDASVLESRELTYHIGVDLGVEPDAKKARQNDTDYWAAAIVAYHRRRNEAFLVDVARRRGMSLTQGAEWLTRVVSGVPSPSVNVESVHAQQYFLTECKNRGLPVSGVTQSRKKEDRLIQMSVPFENDTVKLVNYDAPADAGPESRWQEWVNEWLAFPDGSHDDLLDATEIALRNINLGATYTGASGDMYGRGES